MSARLLAAGLTAGMCLVAGQAFAQLVTCDNATNVQTFEFTGAPQVFVMPELPSGAVISTNLRIEGFGAQGSDGALGSGGGPGGIGGLGGFASGDILAPPPGTELFVFVGGRGAAPTGGFNGGGEGGSQNAGGGGGASDVRLGSSDLSSRVLVAGGGGGAGRGGCFATTVAGGAGGAGGGGSGGNGSDAITSSGPAGGGAGATAQGPGAAGIGCAPFPGQPGFSSVGSVGGKGGNGQSCCCSQIPGGGGGGGGFPPGSGGGGGSAGTVGCQFNDKGAGGGGSGGVSSTTGLVNVTTLPGTRVGDGQVRLCFSVLAPTPVPPAPTATPAPQPTVIPASVLRLEILVPSLGVETLPAPTVAEQSASSQSVVARVCARSAQLRNPRERSTLVIQRVAGKKIVSSTRVTAKAACTSANLTDKGVYRAFLKKSQKGVPVVRSRSNFFGIFG